MIDDGLVGEREKKQDMPAARCRDCGVITWVVNLAVGARKLDNAEHEDGCTRPQGRLDKKAGIPLALQPEALSHPMSDEALEEYE